MQPLVLGKSGESLSPSTMSHEMNDVSARGRMSKGTGWSLSFSHSSE